MVMASRRAEMNTQDMTESKGQEKVAVVDEFKCETRNESTENLDTLQGFPPNSEFELVKDSDSSIGTDETTDSESESSSSESKEQDDTVVVRLMTRCPSMIEMNTQQHHTLSPLPSSENLDEAQDLLCEVKSFIRADKKDRSSIKNLWTRRRVALLFLLVVVAHYAAFRHHGLTDESLAVNTQDSIYVPGAGFSGFWFTLGRLRSIPDPASKHYYCFSAGCLGVVASLRNFSVHEVTAIAAGVQSMWKEGRIGRKQVVGEFLNSLLGPASGLNSTDSEIEDSIDFERLHIITSVKDSWLPPRALIRSPKTNEELREMLIQTTWIPYAVGGSLWHTDSNTGMEHMDGAFSLPFHPRAAHYLGLPFSLDLFANVINVNLGREKVKKFWDAGLAHGL